MASPPATACGPHPIVKSLQDETERPDVEDVAGGLSGLQHGDEPLPIGGAFLARVGADRLREPPD
jgi:hypothetical protein